MQTHSNEIPLNFQKNNVGDLPLHLAIQKGDLEQINYLLNLGANPNLPNGRGYFPLYLAIKNKQTEVIETLLKNGANPNQKNDRGDTLLHIAAQKGDVQTYLQLINLHAEVTATNRDCQTALQAAIRYFDDDFFENETIEKLLTPDLMNLQDKNGETLMHHLFHFRVNRFELAKKLFSKGASIDIQDIHDRTPIDILYFEISEMDEKQHTKIIDNINKETQHCFQISLDDLAEFHAIHELYMVFGGKKLTDQLGHLPGFISGGHVEKAYAFLNENLDAFCNEHSNYLGLKKISHIFNHNFIEIHSTPTDQLLNDILSGIPYLMISGDTTHLIGIMFDKQPATENQQIVLSIAERGPWTTSISLDKVNAIQSIGFPPNKETLKKIITLLSRAKSSDTNQAENILFKEIPDLAKNAFGPNNSIGKQVATKPYKVGICFYANLKTLLHNLFLIYIEQGQQLYDEYEIFLRKKALKHYQETSKIKNKMLIDVCSAIIKDKKNQWLSELQFQPFTSIGTQALLNNNLHSVNDYSKDAKTNHPYCSK